MMERISLPVRTISTRRLVTIPVGVVLIVAMMLWMADVVALRAVGRLGMRDFRGVVLSRRNLQRYVEGDLVEEWSLFLESGGRVHALRGKAERAYATDTWNGEWRYLYARALWREYLGPVSAAGYSVGGLERAELPGAVVTHLRAAIRREPMNRCYRQTLAGVLAALPNAAELREEINALVAQYPPENAYGQMRAAEMLSAGGADRSALLRLFVRAMSLVPSDITSGLGDLTSRDQGTETAKALGPMVVDRSLDGLLQHVGDYAVWSEADDFRNLPPEVHFLTADYLRRRGLAGPAAREYETVVGSVNSRLKAAARVSWRRGVWEFANPFARSDDLTKRMVMGREITLAAAVLRDSKRLSEAIAMYRVQIARTPTDSRARLDLARTLLSHAEVLSGRAREARTARDESQAKTLEAEVQTAHREADQQLSFVLAADPLSTEALDLRSRLPAGTAPTTGRERTP